MVSPAPRLSGLRDASGHAQRHGHAHDGHAHGGQSQDEDHAHGAAHTHGPHMHGQHNHGPHTNGAPTHDGHDGHAHGAPAHDSGQGHDHAAVHRHADQPGAAPVPGGLPASLLMAGALPRLAGAAGLLAGLWLAVAWALGWLGGGPA